jgi:hypothetical protein
MPVHRSRVVEIGDGKYQRDLVRIKTLAPVFESPARLLRQANRVEMQFVFQPVVAGDETALRILDCIGLLYVREKRGERRLELRLCVRIAVGRIEKIRVIRQAVPAGPVGIGFEMQQV